MRGIWVVWLAAVLPGCASGQARLVGTCEGCEAVFEFGDRALTPVDTLPDWDAPGPHLVLRGTIYQPDGRTPAPGVILYVYHTDQEGLYATVGGETGWGRRHGNLRGWIRTDESGRYEIFTLRPAPYPGRDSPAHVHGTVLEPDGSYYWIDEWHFRGDPLLPPDEPGEDAQGGPGLVTLREENGILVAERDIVLGLNVPGYGGG